MGSPAMRRGLLILASAVLAVSLSSRPTAAQTNCTDHTFSGGRIYAACGALAELGASVHWTYHAANGILHPDQKYKHAYVGALLVLVVVAVVLEVVTLTVRFNRSRR